MNNSLRLNDSKSQLKFHSHLTSHNEAGHKNLLSKLQPLVEEQQQQQNQQQQQQHQQRQNRSHKNKLPTKKNLADQKNSPMTSYSSSDDEKSGAGGDHQHKLRQEQQTKIISSGSNEGANRDVNGDPNRQETVRKNITDDDDEDDEDNFSDYFMDDDDTDEDRVRHGSYQSKSRKGDDNDSESFYDAIDPTMPYSSSGTNAMASSISVNHEFNVAFNRICGIGAQSELNSGGVIQMKSTETIESRGSIMIDQKLISDSELYDDDALPDDST